MSSKAGSSKGDINKSGDLSNLKGYDFPGHKPLVPPVLREVGKLAAGVASVSTHSLGSSATGNPRNKYALEPGHSLMDWIRLGASGKDLTAVGPKAGHLPVTPTELALHNKESDAWLSIRGRVYNVTAYFPFHPGGPDELIKAVGRDATSMFEEVHPWVNYEQILNKCYIGPLRSNVDVTAEDLFGKVEKEPQVVQSPPKTGESKQNTPTVTTTVKPEPILLPRFDWIQKLDYITVVFYIGSFSNPMIEINHLYKDCVNIFLTYDKQVFDNEISFSHEVQWPCQTKLSCETGKIEITFKKCQGSIWDNYGVLRQKSKEMCTTNLESKIYCKLVNKIQVNYNTFLMDLAKIDDNKIIVPLGKHIKAFDTINGQEFSRSYTPVPRCLFNKFRNQSCTSDNICLMVKRYPDGNLSRKITDWQIGNAVSISKPVGSFNLQEIEKRESFIILAAGTGITPMFSIILFLLERRIRKCQSLKLLFFNKAEKDILFQTQFENLEKEDSRFKICHVLSQPELSWTGLKGHVSRSLIAELIEEHLKDTTYVKKDIYFMACGPTIFTTLSQQLLKDLDIRDDQIHFFLG